MLYNSTQNAAEVVSAAQAIAQGISKDGGLFVPQEFPKYSAETLNELLKLDYKGRAKKVFADFLSDLQKKKSTIVLKMPTQKRSSAVTILLPWLTQSSTARNLIFLNFGTVRLVLLRIWHSRFFLIFLQNHLKRHTTAKTQ